MASAEVEARLDQAAVEPVERRVERQHHEGQVDIDEPEDDREIVEEELHRLPCRKRLQPDERLHPARAAPQRLEPLVREALAAEQHHQRIGADQQIGPEGQHDTEQQPRPPFLACEGDRHRDRKADDEADQRYQRGDRETLPEDAEIEKLGRALVIGERPRKFDLGQPLVLAEAVEPDDRHRDDEEEQGPEQGRQRYRREDPLVRFPVLLGHPPMPPVELGMKSRVLPRRREPISRRCYFQPSGDGSPPSRGHALGSGVGHRQEARTLVKASSYSG